MTHILIIDDNQSNIEVLGLLLQDYGAIYSAVLYPSDIEASIPDEPTDVIFLDIEFPTANGFTLIEKLRAMEAFAGVPVIAYSVHTSEIDVARRAGFDGFLGKPLDADRFEDQLKRILKGQPVWDVPG